MSQKRALPSAIAEGTSLTYFASSAYCGSVVSSILSKGTGTGIWLRGRGPVGNAGPPPPPPRPHAANAGINSAQTTVIDSKRLAVCDLNKKEMSTTNSTKEQGKSAPKSHN